MEPKVQLRNRNILVGFGIWVSVGEMFIVAVEVARTVGTSVGEMSGVAVSFACIVKMA